MTFPALAAAASATLYVAGAGGVDAGAAMDTGNCQTESAPCATLGYAVTQASSGDTIEISGTLSESGATNLSQSITLADNPDGSGATVDGNSSDTTGLIDVTGTGTSVTVAGLTLENGYNTASYGGGAITHNVGGELTVRDSTLSDNTGNNGGAIDNDDATSGASLVIADSTLTGNSAPDGGAIDNGDHSTNGGGSVTITNSTFYDNSGADGGAVDNDDNDGSGGTVTVTQSTLAGDTGTQLGPEIGNNHYDSGGSVYVAADVFDGSCTDDSMSTGSWVDAGYNASTDASCLGSSPAGTDAATGTDAGDLGSFANNGGTNATLALAVDNPAIGLIPYGTSFSTGPAAALAVNCSLSADQRGVASAPGAACDAGAVQYIEQTLTLGSGIPNSAVVGQSGTTVTASSSSGLAADFSVDAMTSDGACTLSGGSVTFAHAGSCVIDASQSGSQNVDSATTINSSPITVAAAHTSTALSYSAGVLAAEVTAIAPGRGTPSGTVEFQAGSQVLGTARLSGGTARLAYTAPANATTQIVVSYTGTSDYTASTSAALVVSGLTVPPPSVPAPTTGSPTTTTTTAVKLDGISLTSHTITWCSGCVYPRAQLRFTLSAPTTVRLVLLARTDGNWHQVASTLLHGHATTDRYRLAGRWHGQLVPARHVRLLVQLAHNADWATQATLNLTVHSPFTKIPHHA